MGNEVVATDEADSVASSPAAGSGRRLAGRLADLSSDERLARRAAAGDEDAFAAIFRRYEDRLFRFCVAILGDRDDAQDALQSTMVKALRALPGERRTIELRPWLYRVAHNEAIELRRRGRPTEPLDAELPARGSVEETASGRERLGLLLADIGELPERQRAALVMRELGDLPFKEIGKALAVTPAGARQTIYEARRGLTQMGEGREMPCEEVTAILSAEDGRRSGRRDVRAHLRSCADCRAFAEAIEGRRETLGAIAPLPVGLGAALVAGVLGGGGSGLGGAGAAGGVGAAGGAAAAGGTAAAGGAAAAGGGAVAGAGVAGALTGSAVVKGAIGVLAIAVVGVTAADHGRWVGLGGGGDSSGAAHESKRGAGTKSSEGSSDPSGSAAAGSAATDSGASGRPSAAEAVSRPPRVDRAVARPAPKGDHNHLQKQATTAPATAATPASASNSRQSEAAEPAHPSHPLHPAHPSGANTTQAASPSHPVHPVHPAHPSQSASSTHSSKPKTTAKPHPTHPPHPVHPSKPAEDMSPATETAPPAAAEAPGQAKKGS